MAPDVALKLDRTTRLAVGDVVSVAVGSFGEEYARSRGATPWHSEAVRDQGRVVGREGGKWSIQFADGRHPFERKAIAFVSRDEAPGARRAAALEAAASSDDDDARPHQPDVDSSDEELEDVVGAAEHEGGRAAAECSETSDWVRDDDYGVDERARQGFTDQSGPRISGLSDWENSSLFSFALHWLPLAFVAEMAAAMEKKGLEKYAEGNISYKNWTVTRDDLLQWIGVWIYMLAHPQPGERRAYFMEPPRGFGPRHRLAEYLKLGRNGDGEKGIKWFEMMHACFTLPVYDRSDGDPFQKTCKWWDALRDAFFAAITASWLLVMDESMVQWMGRGMPGLMVILRKPTPIGLELHTLCCAMCGVLVWFEVFEGKELMAKKEFNDRYPKSVALSLRMLKPFFSSGRVLIADSWFGSVACTLALFAHGIFAVMNVKTATKGYPKEQLLEVVEEIKGKSEEARRARRKRRGEQIAFVKSFRVGSRQVTITAGGHNKKVPLLLVATYGSMLPGEEHSKTWQIRKADGSVEYKKITTKQTQMHALYRRWMNVVDLHNKLRQGVASMADVWHTTSWAERHFAEGLGFWEVNVYKALIYFFSKHASMSHGEFRSRLAWALMTLGKEPYPRDAVAESAVRITEAAPGESSMGIAPLLYAEHVYVRHPKDSCLHRCAYCGKPSYWKCTTCEFNGLGILSVCGPRASKDRQCRKRHSEGQPVMHSTFKMTNTARVKSAIARRKRACAATSGAYSTSGGMHESESE